MLDRLIYIVTAPIRLFGRSRAFRWSLAAILVIGTTFGAATWALNKFLPPASDAKKAVASLPSLPALKPVSRPSFVIAPVAISIPAIGRSLDAAAPRDFSGNSNNPVSSLLSQAQIGMTVTRGPMSVAGRADGLTVTTPINGALQVTGQLAGAIGGIAGGLTGLLNSTIGKDVKGLTTQVLDQKAELRGNIIVRSKPTFAANWRLEPNLTAQVALGDSALSIAGIRLNMSNEAKPLIEQTVNQQVAALQARLRNDPSIERAAREQWAQMCRTIPVGGATTGLPQLYLELKPVRAAAAQPLIDERNITLTIGVEAESRIVATATKPSCPFPARLDLVPKLESGLVNVVVPIDLPFKDLNKAMEAQLKGRRFPDDKNAPVEVEVRRASLAAAGDRLLIALHVKAIERKSWFGFGAEADVNIWGKPTLDPKTQVLRLTDLTLAVDSEAAYGLLGAAARAAMPYLQQALADNAVIDLTPFIADAKAKIDTALRDFTKDSGGVRVDAVIRELRVTGVEFDSNTLRVVTEAVGSAKVAVTELPRL